jgi:glycosyltransferase involved in cell wall biosynthesis
MEQRPLNVLIWNVHGGYTNSLARLPHQVLLPTTAERGAYGLGKGNWKWPNAIEVDCDDLAAQPIDVAIVQRVDELHLLQRWSGRKPGLDFPMVYLEHNTPGGSIPFTRHHMSDRSDCVVVHVTHFNSAMWDTGSTPTRVIEHGVVDPGQLWLAEIPHAAVIVNDPVKRGRAVGADLLPFFAQVAPIDVYGRRSAALSEQLGGVPDLVGHDDLEQQAMYAEIARRAVCLYPNRWTSMSLSLIEAMMLGMPVVAFATTEVTRAVPPAAGCISTDVDELRQAMAQLVRDPGRAQHAGQAAREAAMTRYNLERFINDWDSLLRDVVTHGPSTGSINVRDVVTVGQ